MFTPRLQKRVSVFFAIVASAAMAGCGGSGGMDTAPVKGKVLYNGEPLPYGSVSFRPSAGSPATGEIQSDGSFRLTTYKEGDGAIIGTHQVLVSATEAHAGTSEPVDPNTEMLVPKSVIPTKYGSFEASGLTAEVVAGNNNELVLELTD